MPRLKGTKPSDNFVDTVGNPITGFLTTLFDRLKPSVKKEQYASELIDQGWKYPQSYYDSHPNIGGRVNFRRRILDSLLQEIISNQKLVDPHVIMSSEYGDLIPTEERFDYWNKKEQQRKK